MIVKLLHYPTRTKFWISDFKNSKYRNFEFLNCKKTCRFQIFEKCHGGTWRPQPHNIRNITGKKTWNLRCRGENYFLDGTWKFWKLHWKYMYVNSLKLAKIYCFRTHSGTPCMYFCYLFYCFCIYLSILYSFFTLFTLFTLPSINY